MRSWLAADPPLAAGVVPHGGTDYNQAEVLRAVDGDTARLHRRRFTVEEVDREDLGGMVCSEHRVRVWEDDVLELPTGVAGRLVNLDTPERGEAGYAQATLDLRTFVGYAGDRLRCITYDQGGGFDRLLVDLYYWDNTGRRWTATEHMLGRGWLPYVEGR